MEEWMAYEPDATDTEQAYLTWGLAPVARAGGTSSSRFRTTNSRAT